MAAAAAGLAVPALANPGVQLAQATPAKPAPQGPKAVTRAAVIQDMDTTFKAVDSNHNGALEKSEIATAQAATLQKATSVEQQRLVAQFDKLDTNKDGQLSKAEFLAAVPAVRARETPDQMLSQLDANKDGKVSVEEYRAPRLAVFDKVDANHDGTVSPQEAQAARNAAGRKK
jgi:hypothetical protein